MKHPVKAPPLPRGLTLRDWFAGLAGKGAQQVADKDNRYDETNWAAVVAANAYEMADAMLEHRKHNR